MEPCAIRVMSFNVRGASHKGDGPNVWPDRAATNVAAIRRYSPDLIGFQEAQDPNLEVYARELPGYARIPGPAYGPPDIDEYNAVFFDPERLQMLDSGGFWLSDTPERPLASWQEIVRSVNWAHLRCPETGASFLLLNTHLDHSSETARAKGGQLILGKVREILAGLGENPPVLVTGDFNSRPGSAAYQTFTEAGFVDTFLAAGNKDGEDAFTFHAFKGKSFTPRDTDKPHGRIDWILTSDSDRLRARSHAIVRDSDEETGVYPSDHYPVLAELAVER